MNAVPSELHAAGRTAVGRRHPPDPRLAQDPRRRLAPRHPRADARDRAGEDADDVRRRGQRAVRASTTPPARTPIPTRASTSRAAWRRCARSGSPSAATPNCWPACRPSSAARARHDPKLDAVRFRAAPAAAPRAWPAPTSRRCTTRAAASSRRRWSSSPSARTSASRRSARRTCCSQHPGETLRRQHPEAHHARIRARRSRARPRHHPQQHQPPGKRADDHRPQLPDQDQRQHRQLRGVVGHRRGSGEAGLGDPLGRRHGDGPVHRQAHPRNARVDHPQLAGADRHGADLPGAGEGRRPRRGTDLGDLPRHADRAGRAGRGLLHHPRRRAAALRAADREARHRHRLARRFDPGQVVPGAPQGKLPLHALRGHLRNHEGLRRGLLARRRPASGLDRRRQRRRAVRRAGNAGRADARSPGSTTSRP